MIATREVLPELRRREQGREPVEARRVRALRELLSRGGDPREGAHRLLRSLYLDPDDEVAELRRALRR